MLVCEERVNISELEIFTLCQVTIHLASACRNLGFLSPGIQQYYLVVELNWTCSYNSKQSIRCKIGWESEQRLHYQGSIVPSQQKVVWLNIAQAWRTLCLQLPGWITEAVIFGAERRWASNGRLILGVLLVHAKKNLPSNFAISNANSVIKLFKMETTIFCDWALRRLLRMLLIKYPLSQNKYIHLLLNVMWRSGESFP